MDKYKDKTQDIDVRVENLLSRMTLKEKVGQLNQKMFGWNAYRRKGDSIELTEEFKAAVEFGDGMGALYGLFRADPWSGVTFDTGIPVEKSAQVANMIQRYVIENTRLGIPVLISEECPHGHQALDGTMLPTNLGIGCTWNPELYREAASQVAAEIRSRGGNLGLISLLDIVRDPRWGRSEECFSEDPYHAARMAVAAVKGLQGEVWEELKSGDKVVAVMKHFCAQGASVGGHNAAPAPIGERELREIFLPGMKAGVEAGALGCMAAYNEIDGIPCHANKKLLIDILRDEWGFDGIVMADGIAIDKLLSLTGDHEGAAALALTSGIDLSLWDDSFTTLEEAVKQGKVSEEYIDRAVSRVLKLKFMLGLFENPYTDENLASQVVCSPRAEKVNLQLARESIVMLKNEDNLLPIDKNIRSIAVIGPNADNLYNQLGDYTAPQRKNTGFTVLQGLESVAPPQTELIYAKGCGIRDMSKEGFQEAIDAAKRADIAVVVLGGSSARDFSTVFDINGAAIIGGDPAEMDCGEGVDLADLELGGVQVELLKEIEKTGTPVVVVLIQGRPHAIPWIAENCKAILCGWYPGKEGGRAIAEVLFGDYNPSGKLSVSIPRASAQLPVYYNHKDLGLVNSYLDMDRAPLYHFGHGLSYTEFKYSNLEVLDGELTVKDLQEGKNIKVKVSVENTGDLPGEEVVQLYIMDLEASIMRRIKELKGFKKMHLNPGEKRDVIFTLGEEELGIWNREMEFCVEPGNVKIFVGGNSQDNLETTYTII
jgi:beta-glucosidase